MWVQLILLVVSYIVQLLMTPKQVPPKASTLEDFNIPKAEEGAEFGKAYGTVWIKSPQIPWYGDFRSTAIRSSGGKK